MLEGVPRFGLFIGVGHPFRRDDGVGPWLADRLADAGFDAVAHVGDGAGLIARFGAAQDILVADAMQGGRPPGSAVLLDARLAPMPEGRFRNSTHEFGLVHAVETARALGLLPRSLWVLGIEGEDFGFGEGLSDAVARKAAQVLDAIVASPRARAHAEGGGPRA